MNAGVVIGTFSPRKRARGQRLVSEDDADLQRIMSCGGCNRGLVYRNCNDIRVDGIFTAPAELKCEPRRPAMNKERKEQIRQQLKQPKTSMDA